VQRASGLGIVQILVAGITMPSLTSVMEVGSPGERAIDHQPRIATSTAGASSRAASSRVTARPDIPGDVLAQFRRPQSQLTERSGNGVAGVVADQHDGCPAIRLKRVKDGGSSDRAGAPVREGLV